MSVIHIDRNNFQSEVLDSDRPVLLDFWAPWCTPCRMVGPILDEIAGERSDIKVAKVNVDEQPELAGQFGVMSIPTLVVMKEGRIVQQAMGAGPRLRSCPCCKERRIWDCLTVGRCLTSDRAWRSSGPRLGRCCWMCAPARSFRRGTSPEAGTCPCPPSGRPPAWRRTRETPLFVYCYSGARSGQAVHVLRRMGVCQREKYRRHRRLDRRGGVLK